MDIHCLERAGKLRHISFHYFLLWNPRLYFIFLFPCAVTDGKLLFFTRYTASVIQSPAGVYKHLISTAVYLLLHISVLHYLRSPFPVYFSFFTSSPFQLHISPSLISPCIPAIYIIDGPIFDSPGVVKGRLKSRGQHQYRAQSVHRLHDALPRERLLANDLLTFE